jgi:hypothetical protein
MGVCAGSGEDLYRFWQWNVPLGRVRSYSLLLVLASNLLTFLIHQAS